MNKPVAWMQDYQNCKCPDNEARCFSDLVFRMMQKHTHPVKELTPLTEDECRTIIEKHNWFAKSWTEMAMEIHDAILRKAQENG